MGQFVSAQFDRKTTVGKRQAYVYWGYNRTFYNQSDINFIGTGYNFSMVGVSASDNPEPFRTDHYFNPSRLTINQYNFRAGYYIKNKWALSLGIDQFRYVVDNYNQVQLYGDIDLLEDGEQSWNGNYNGEDYLTDRRSFHYENSGLSYWRAGVDYWHPLTRPNRLRKWSLSSTLGIGAGVIASATDFTFAQKEDRHIRSISGFALSAHAGLRFEMWDHLFLQSNVGAGYINQFKVKTRRNDFGAFAQQAMTYAEHNIVIGWLFKIKGKKDCDCPKW